jgi:outer membrane biosynthesis protein TonB
VRIFFLAGSAATLLAVGTALSFQAGRSLALSVPALPLTVAAAPPASNAPTDGDAAAPAGPVERPTAAPVIVVKSIRVEPERPPLKPDAERQAPTPVAAGVQQQETTPTSEQPAPPAVAAASPELLAQKARAHQVKSAVVGAKRSPHPKRKLSLAAADRTASGPEMSAIQRPGPESLNPLGKLLTQGKL